MERRKCTGKSSSGVKLDECGIKTVTHFTSDLDEVDTELSKLVWPQGSTLTSLALMTAETELTLGRADVNTLVVVLTDGRPLSYRKTLQASRTIRKKARLLWVPVRMPNYVFPYIKQWATRRWQENVVKVEDFKSLQTPETITHIIADVCPKEDPEIRFERL
jgi:hypothetical protein